MVQNSIPRVYFYFLLHGKEFQVVFSSAEWFGTEFREFSSIFVPWNGISSCVLFRRRVRNRLWEFASIFVLRKGIPSYFLFRGRVRNGIPRFSVPRNNRNSVGNNHLFRLFRLPRNYFFVGNSQPHWLPMLLAPVVNFRWYQQHQRSMCRGYCWHGGAPWISIFVNLQKKFKWLMGKSEAWAKTREYWMIYRGPGFLAVVWFGSSSTPSHQSHPLPSVSSTGNTQEDWEREATCWWGGGERGRGRSHN